MSAATKEKEYPVECYRCTAIGYASFGELPPGWVTVIGEKNFKAQESTHCSVKCATKAYDLSVLVVKKGWCLE